MGEDERAPAPPPCNFMGRWLCTAIEGESEKLMAVMGANWLIRKLAASLSFAKGTQVQEIAQQGDVLTISNSGMGPKTTVFTMTVGAGEQDTLTMSGQKNRATPVWEGASLLIRSVMYKGHVERRYLEGGCMVLEQTVGDVREKRTFTLKP